MQNAEPDSYDVQAVCRVYDGMAADYAVRYGAELREPDTDTNFLDAALAELPDGPVLDVGCGPAQVSGYLIARGKNAIGLDIAPGMLAAAARMVPEAGLVAADLLELPFGDETCAAAVASYSLHHLPRARLGGALAGLARVLKPGGVLVMITHGGGGEELLDRPEGHVVFSTYSSDELAAMLSGCGLVPELTRVRPPREGEWPADKIRISARR